MDLLSSSLVGFVRAAAWFVGTIGQAREAPYIEHGLVSVRRGQFSKLAGGGRVVSVGPACPLALTGQRHFPGTGSGKGKDKVQCGWRFLRSHVGIYRRCFWSLLALCACVSFACLLALFVVKKWVVFYACFTCGYLTLWFVHPSPVSSQ
jgi:hypothetical protein